MSNPSVRDEKADYKAAYLADYEAYKQDGRTKEASAVAKILRDHYGHEVDKPAKKAATAKKAAAPERADVEKPAENTAEPKPKHKG